MPNHVVKVATLDDIDQMLVNAEAFLKVIGADVIEFNRESMAEALTDCVLDGICLLITDEAGLHLGGLGAVIVPLPMNNKDIACYERFWWVAPGERSKGVGQALLTAAVDAARAKGCTRLVMVAMENVMLAAVEKAYLKFGLKPRERTYDMRL